MRALSERVLASHLVVGATSDTQTREPVPIAASSSVQGRVCHHPSMSEHQHGQAVLNEVVPLGRTLRQAIPDVYRAFAGFNQAAFAPGSLDTKTKELIALAIAVSERCDGCIASHARGASRAGASREEAAETIGVALAMNGGPATVYGPRAYDAFCEFADARDAAAADGASANGTA